MYFQPAASRGLGRLGRGRLGDVCNVLSNGARVCSSPPLGVTMAIHPPVSNLRYPIYLGVKSPNYSINYPCPAWGCGPTGISTHAPVPSLPVSLVQQLQNNPGSLTPAQWAQLQAAGMVAGTLPYSSASQLPTPGTGGAVDPSTLAAPSASTDAFSTMYGPLPLWGWLAVAGGAYFVFAKKGR